ncbi:hypothetical protein EJB05_01520 [Eragrostis curvula]|uniref:BTB domain-containing protein n=1 Tax=Eragrostis curvula TaxID=38414 RepID=A0A5J9WS28_9POAL|nr:hypothetical protein EJB05_01520 [Eragrostis curvula]
MNLTCSHFTEAQVSGRLLKIDGCLPYNSPFTIPEHNKYVASRWEVDGYEWEIRFYPRNLGSDDGYDNLALELVFLSEARGNHVKASLSYRLLDPSGIHQPSAEKISPSKSFLRPSDSSGKLRIMTRTAPKSSGYLNMNGSVFVLCVLVVHKDPGAIPKQSPDLQKDLCQLLRSEAGADVTFIVSGEHLAAHKNILAARSPVFMAEFFGQMKETSSKCIEIKDMEAEVFKAMLGFIYTDTVPELDEMQGTATAMAQHLLVAADRYALDKLKVMCERRLALGVDAATVATTLALAEQHGCSQLKAKCVEFIAGGSSENLDAVLATEGFKCLEASSPSVVTEILRAVHAWRIKK